MQSESLRRWVRRSCRWAGRLRWAAFVLGIALGAAVRVRGAEPASPARERVDHDRGYTYFNDKVAEVPWSIHVFKLDRTHPEFEFATTAGHGDEFGMSTVSEQLKALPPGWGQPVAAVNGDFYNRAEHYEGRPRDLQIRDGEVLSGPTGHAVLWIDPAGHPQMTNVTSRFRVVWPGGATSSLGLNEARGEASVVLYTAAVGTSTHTVGGLELELEAVDKSAWLPLRLGRTNVARVRSVRKEGDTPVGRDSLVLSVGPGALGSIPAVTTGAELKLITETTPDLAGVKVAIGGGPTLVRGGKAMQWNGMIHMRHPRSAVGWNKDHFFLVEVDGRQSNLSVGMTFPELAAYMVKLGCDEAMNLDGGGSSTLWVMGNVMNNPSEGRERPGVNSLVVRRKNPSAR